MVIAGTAMTLLGLYVAARRKAGVRSRRQHLADRSVVDPQLVSG
jgi:hypothetical protein